MHCISWCVVLMVLYTTATFPSRGARMLGVLSTDSKSCYFNLRNVAEELALRGHQVSLLVSSAVSFLPSNAIKHIVFQSPFEKDYLEKILVPKVSEQSPLTLLRNYRAFVEACVSACRSLLTYVNSHLEEFHDFELVFADTPPGCGAFVADLLKLPRIDIAPAFVTRMGVMEMGPISYIPVLMSFNTDKMNFVQRAKNLLHHLTGLLLGYFVGFRSFDGLNEEFNTTLQANGAFFMSSAELLIVTGHFALEYSQPLLPAVKLVGPLTIKPTKPLPRDIEQFVNGAGEKGIVLLSLGTLSDHVLHKTQVDMLAEVLRRLEQRVLWRAKGYVPKNISSNIKVVGWIPQNDLLVHNSTKAFISHTGHNSFYEAAFYGVPLVCIPLCGDQFSNCLQAQSVGTALAVDIKTATKDEVRNSIQRVLNEASFKGNATRISRLMRDSPRTSVQQAADWIEYVHRHKGANHLRPEVFNLHWYQRYLVDVLAFIVFDLIAIICLMQLLLRYLCSILRTGAKKRGNLKTD